jgi:mevalonate kinase
MPAISAAAPGKVILVGEHAVVYGRPAIAVPVSQVRARAILTAAPRRKPGSLRLQAPAIGLEADWRELPPEHPLVKAIALTLQATGISHLPACDLRVTSTIPVASGMGSGAAVTVAVIRGLSNFLGRPLDNETISALAFQVEKIHHGTPSGIDNSVVTYEKPIYFMHGEPIVTLQVSEPFHLVIGNTGVSSPTAIAVGDVRQAWLSDKASLESIFDEIGYIARQARQLIESGQTALLGPLLDRDHELLRQLAVSSPELDRLVEAALEAGALGAKMSGGGRGGNMIALVTSQDATAVAEALGKAGAVQTIQTKISQ